MSNPTGRALVAAGIKETQKLSHDALHRAARGLKARSIGSGWTMEVAIGVVIGALVIVIVAF